MGITLGKQLGSTQRVSLFDNAVYAEMVFATEQYDVSAPNVFA
jgi:hypothetical protein